MQLIHVFGKFHIDCHLKKRGQDQVSRLQGCGQHGHQPMLCCHQRERKDAQGPHPSAAAAAPARPTALLAGGPATPVPLGLCRAVPAPYLIFGLVVRDGEAVGDLHRVLVHSPCGRAARSEDAVGAAGCSPPG